MRKVVDLPKVGQEADGEAGEGGEEEVVVVGVEEVKEEDAAAPEELQGEGPEAGPEAGLEAGPAELHLICPPRHRLDRLRWMPALLYVICCRK